MAERIPKGEIKNKKLKQLETVLRSIESGDHKYQKALTEMMKWYEKTESEQPFTLLIIGQTGSGKSTLINNIFEDKVAEANNEVDSQTVGIQKYVKTVREVEVTVYDTPGLQDTNNRDEEILKEIKKLIDSKAFSAVIFCFKITENRRLEQTVEDFKKYHEIGIPWNKAVVALTFADRLTKDDGPVEKHVQKWKDSIRNDILVKQVGLTPDTARQIAFRPTTKRPHSLLPGNKNWFIPLWFSVLCILEPKPMMEFMSLHIRQGTFERTGVDDSAEDGTLDFIIRQKKKSLDQMIVRIILMVGKRMGLFSSDENHDDSDTEHGDGQQTKLRVFLDSHMMEETNDSHESTQ